MAKLFCWFQSRWIIKQMPFDFSYHIINNNTDLIQWKELRYDMYLTHKSLSMYSIIFQVRNKLPVVS